MTLVKERQSTSQQESVSPLSKQDSTATSSREKAELLADFFSTKMNVTDSKKAPSELEQECDQINKGIVDLGASGASSESGGC